LGDPLTGQTLANRYELIERVGEGGMAVVYRARDGLLGRIVAIKILREQFASDSEFLTRFRLEARAAASLSHPNVVNIYDVGEDHGVHYIVMEYVQGRNLKEIIRSRKPMPVAEACAIGLQIARALEAAHQRELVHRDIKPHNILIMPDGTVKVTDFGIAQAASSASLTQTGTVIGSVHYFSPEQARGENVDAATDIYSLGVVMYEMVTGRLPFTGDNPVAVALKHLQERPIPPSHLNPDVPAALERVSPQDARQREGRSLPQRAQLIQDLRSVKAAIDREGSEEDDEALAFSEQATQVTPVVIDNEPTLIRRGQEGVGTMPKARAKRRGRRWLVYTMILFSFLGGMVWAAQKLPDLIFPEVVRVPEIVGLDLVEARNRLEAVGLRLASEVNDVYSREAPAGVIVRQDPEAHHMVRMGREIKVTVSRGPEYVVVPDVIGLPKIEAQLQITQQKLVMGEIREEYNPSVPPNTVIGQDPPPDTRLEAGKPVDIVVARGSLPQETVMMPDVRGVPLAEAKARLEALGLVEGQLHPEPHPTAPEGQVIDQNPRPGEEVEVGYPYALAYAVTEFVPGGASGPSSAVEDKNWERSIFINVPEGPPQEVVILVTDDWGTRVVYREVARGGSRFNHVVKMRGDVARIQVWFDGVPQMDDTLRRPGAGGG